MSHKAIARYTIFGDASKKSSDDLVLKSSGDLTLKSSCDLMELSPKNEIHPEIHLLNKEKKVTILDYMNDKIEDPDIAIETLKKELEKSLARYAT